jgi:hypothetical protein
MRTTALQFFGLFSKIFSAVQPVIRTHVLNCTFDGCCNHCPPKVALRASFSATFAINYDIFGVNRLCYNSMKRHSSDRHTPSNHDKQLQGITLDAVMEKRRLDQALNAKEFAVCAGVSYSTARSWFHLPGFPVFHGVVFWRDFVEWRTHHLESPHDPEVSKADHVSLSTNGLPPRAASILNEAH